jgi:hypothetical protein
MVGISIFIVDSLWNIVLGINVRFVDFGYIYMRVGTKLGKKTFVSIGKSGTYVSTWIGGLRFSKFSPKRKSKKTKEETIHSNVPVTTRETIGFVLHTLLVIVCTWLLFVLFAKTSLFWYPLGLVLGVHTIAALCIWIWAKSELVKTMWALPFIGLIFPIGWVWWIVVIVGYFLV